MPVLSNFLYRISTIKINLSSIYFFGPIHNLSPGVSRTLKRSSMKGLRDNPIHTDAISANDRRKAFPTVRRKILYLLNTFLVKMESESMEQELRVDFTNLKSMAYLDGLFTEKGLVGVLEAKDVSNIDKVSSFLAA